MSSGHGRVGKTEAVGEEYWAGRSDVDCGRCDCLVKGSCLTEFFGSGCSLERSRECVLMMLYQLSCRGV